VFDRASLSLRVDTCRLRQRALVNYTTEIALKIINSDVCLSLCPLKDNDVSDRVSLSLR
jgi:hypothetical protein